MANSGDPPPPFQVPINNNKELKLVTMLKLKKFNIFKYALFNVCFVLIKIFKGSSRYLQYLTLQTKTL